MSNSEGRALLENALEGVRIVACPTCRCEGRVGSGPLRVTCPTCRGGGLTTERPSEHKKGEDEQAPAG